MDIGNLAEWVAGLGTVATLAVSLYLVQNERKLRSMEQAQKVSTWSEWQRKETPNPNPRQFFAYINNASDYPVYVETLAAFPVSGEPQRIIGEPQRIIFERYVAGHSSVDYGLDEQKFPRDRLPPPMIEVLFRDVNYVWWSCNSQGLLRREQPPPSPGRPSDKRADQIPESSPSTDQEEPPPEYRYA